MSHLLHPWSPKEGKQSFDLEGLYDENIMTGNQWECCHFLIVSYCIYYRKMTTCASFENHFEVTLQYTLTCQWFLYLVWSNCAFFWLVWLTFNESHLFTKRIWIFTSNKFSPDWFQCYTSWPKGNWPKVSRVFLCNNPELTYKLWGWHLAPGQGAATGTQHFRGAGGNED